MRNLLGLRTIFAMAILAFGSAVARATPCEDAWDRYLGAQFGYESARLSYFYGIPTTCLQECLPLPQGPQRDQCIQDCQTSRYTDLGQADISMFTLALDTCAPSSLDECAQARATADSCFTQFDPSCYSDPDEADAVNEERWACWTASKVDHCE